MKKPKLKLITSELDEAFAFAIGKGVLSLRSDDALSYHRNWVFAGKVVCNNQNGYTFQHKSNSRTRITVMLNERKSA